METSTTETTESPVVGEIIPETPVVETPINQPEKSRFDNNGVKTDPEQTADDRLNAMILAELEQNGGKSAWTVFFETGQISTFIIKDREKLEAKLNGGGNSIEIPEAQDVKGFTNGKVFVQKDKIVFSILRDKSAIIQPDRKLVLASR